MEESKPTLRAGTYVATLLLLLREHGPMTARQIADALGDKSVRRASEVCKKLRKKELVEAVSLSRGGVGQPCAAYDVTDTGREAKIVEPRPIAIRDRPIPMEATASSPVSKKATVINDPEHAQWLASVYADLEAKRARAMIEQRRAASRSVDRPTGGIPTATPAGARLKNLLKLPTGPKRL